MHIIVTISYFMQNIELCNLQDMRLVKGSYVDNVVQSAIYTNPSSREHLVCQDLYQSNLPYH